MSRSHRAVAESFILDSGASGVTVNASTSQQIQATGTFWPLLPRQSMRIFNASLVLEPDSTSLKLKIEAMRVSLGLYDQAQNFIIRVAVLCAANFTDPAYVGKGGFAIESHGDPIAEFVSSFLITTSITVPPAFAALGGSVDITNTDSGASHGCTATLNAVLGFHGR